MTLDLYDPKTEELASRTCCEACQAPKVKYISVDTAHDYCGVCCMLPSHYIGFKTPWSS